VPTDGSDPAGFERLDHRAAVLAAAGHHPYARLSTGGLSVIGYRTSQRPHLVGWLGHNQRGPIVAALGDPDQAIRLVLALCARGDITADTWVHLPRLPARPTAAPARPTAAPARPTAGRAQPADRPTRDDWDFRWTTAAPPPAPGEDGVTEIWREAEISSLITDSFPQSTTRPGDPRIRHWYGIRTAGGRLAAIAADHSRGGVGFIAGLAVHPAYRRHGFGTALAASLTRRLHAEFGIAALGVMTANNAATRMYQKIGYLDSTERTSLKLSDVDQ
jgi:ribosomal protein S18 acetylase RimI-like enzyme